jgi:predicted porin
MIGGLNWTGRLTIAAIFCAFGGVSGMEERAEAADLGGDCCADLEERVAELEATTARKGNKKVTVQVYGKVNKFTMWWDDGAEQNVYTEDNSYSSTRFGFRGTGKINDDWSGGYRMEMENRVAASNATDQFDDDNADDADGSIRVRHSYMFLKSKKYGETRLGLTSTPKDDIVKDTLVTELQDTMFGDFDSMRSFILRPSGFNNAEGLRRLRWQDIARAYSSADQFDVSTRRNGVAYWSPEWHGFTASWGWFEDDIWSAALRYKSPKEWENWKIGAGFAYEDFRDERIQAGAGGAASRPNPPNSGRSFFKRDIKEWAGSASVKHVPTGLFVYGEYSASEQDDSDTIGRGFFNGSSPPQMNAWDLQIGIQREFEMFRLGELGETAFFGGGGQVIDGISCGGGFPGDSFNGNVSSAGSRIPPDCFIRGGGVDLANVLVNSQITGAEVNRWYLGLDQGIESAQMHLYTVYQHYEADIDLITRGDGAFQCNAAGKKCEPVGGKLRRVFAPLDDFDLIYSGARIYF